jgi:hypothetical protein
VIPGTVEDRVLSLQDKKKALIQGALDNKAVGKLTYKDLGFLFVSLLNSIALTNADNKSGCQRCVESHFKSLISPSVL